MNKLILVINCGSSSLKTTLFDYTNLSKIIECQFKDINLDHPKLVVSASGENEEIQYSSKISIKECLSEILNYLSQNNYHLNGIKLIGHRIVHGGCCLNSNVLINADVLNQLKETIELAPLHNRPSLEGIEACYSLFPKCPQYAVFDTTYFQDMPEIAQTYAIPKLLSEKFSIRRYGFHGISHEYLWKTYSKIKNKKKIITLHLGNGCSATAIENGKPLDTSMGFTPLEGLMMATRCGDIDVGVVEYLAEKLNKNITEVVHLLNYESGLLGVSGVSSSMKDLLEQSSTDSSARKAVDMFCYRIIKYIGAYTAVLGGVDALIFSAGIGENSPEIRQKVVDNLNWLGIHLDTNLNSKAVRVEPGTMLQIHSKESKVEVYVIGTDENVYISEIVKNLSEREG